MNIDDELFELEKKYGEFKVRKPSTLGDDLIEETKKADTSYESLKLSGTVNN